MFCIGGRGGWEGGGGCSKEFPKCFFNKILIHSYVLLLPRTICLGKNGFMSYGPKTSWLITMQDSLKYNISQTSWGMKLKFCILLNIYRNNNFTQSFRMGLVRYPWACPELCEIMSHLKNELSYKVFCLWLGIHRSYKFLYSFQVRVVRDAHNVWK